MSTSHDPFGYEVNISEELRALLRRDNPAPVDLEAADDMAEPDAGHIDLQINRVFSLRRDGARPVRFCGAPILEMEVGVREGGLGRQALSVYFGQDGEVVAQILVEPPENLPARPTYRVSQVATADDLCALVSCGSPENVLLPSGEQCTDMAALTALQNQNKHLSEATAPFLRNVSL